MPAGEARGNSPMPGIGCRFSTSLTRFAFSVQWMENNAGIMYHTWGAMIERASRDSRVVPGDVLGGGTVTGGSIGEAIRNGFPARYLEPGDVVEIEVEGIGILRNTIAPKLNPDFNYRFKAPRSR